MELSSTPEVHMHHGRFGLSLINSMIGGYLEQENNPLAVQMGFYHQSKKLNLADPIQAQVDFTLSNKVIVFVHGLANLENTWDFPPEDTSTRSILSHYIDVNLNSAIEHAEQNYGVKLNEELGFTPLFLRYNAGLSLEKNAQSFSRLLNKLHENYPLKIDELVLVGYGMGGRLLSHAQFIAKVNQAAWLQALTRCMYLGKLNEGSLFTLALRLGGMLVRKLPIFYNSCIADWLEHQSTQTNEVASNKQNKPARTQTNTCFLEDKRHFFVDSDLKNESSHSDSNNKYITPVSAPSHSQSAYIEQASSISLTHSENVYSLLRNWIITSSGENVELKTYSSSSSLAIDNTDFSKLDSIDTNNNLMLAGGLGLVASAYDKTIETIETVHYSLAEEPFYALDKLPLVSQIAKPVESAQRELLDKFYRDLRNRGKKIHKLAAELV